MDDIVREFLVESHENLDQLDQDLVALESSPGSRELLGSVFRTVHTIKGTSGFLAFSQLERVTHAGENLLVELRDGRRAMDGPTTDLLLRLVDTVRAILAAIDATGGEGAVPVDDVIDAITILQRGGSAAAAPVADVPVADAPADEATVAEAAAAEPPATEPPVSEAPDQDLAPVDASATPADVSAVPPAAAPATPAVEPAEPSGVPTGAEDPATDAAPGVPHQRGAVAVPPVATPSAPPAPAAPVTPADDSTASRGVADSSIRVDVDLLDALMRQVGELVLARNQITRLASSGEDVELSRTAQRLNLIAGELQEGVMKTRMQPIEHVWSKMPRVVRDLAAHCDREVQLEMTGGDTELDRSLLEAVKDPLTHLVRNAVDHGIESPAERAAAGKRPKGTLSLRAYHAGGQVVVEIADDGRGIDPEKIAAKAIERGLRTAEQIAAMSAGEIINLVFHAGFSTAEAVTNVSGRGVGMDVVRTKIEAIGGAVDVESTVGLGTVWRLGIPLTLAIMPALTVECAGDLFAVPQVSLLELVALDTQRSRAGIEYVHAAPVYRLRGELLPLVSLAGVLEVGAGPEAGVEQQGVIAVVQADQQRFGLLVDRVLNTEEIVVKPLSARLKSIGVYAGATVLGDGHVALILDVQSIARRALTSEGELARAARDVEAEVEVVTHEQVLVVGIGHGRRVAMPLASVARLELVPADQVELVGGREVIQYRGTILPLARLDRVLRVPGAGGADAAELLLVVYTHDGRSVGLVVDEIIDIVDDDAGRRSDIEDTGLLGSTVLGDRVTELLDVRGAVLAADPSFYDADPSRILVGAHR
ncbi:chemotaxis protein CheA [Cellulomonas chengniuliangii]|uniref:histidine kinase n=1 Tax=Cellulomonas chengniuliangii TaxID=2968084 RepID=A0ABY5L1M0_9CELL|nr:chemotaxis protein CheA [Cellulomonas chengniuliangii]MCC2307246.1 chemotaxis protein CheA [Cellulomonas chengniuliangii]MCC2317858.1 chemotaxis protein CheA [Cellulomonas chengniuliangii]UUI75958.1 chemotaxis protein CheA [Cellulomonas chengniuliangii]